VDLAIKEKDHMFNNFLQWYVAEQVEEEDNSITLTRKLKRAGDNVSLLMQVDAECAARTFTAPVIPGTKVGAPTAP
jgi:ferritin